jgi:hypothetical protein
MAELVKAEIGVRSVIVNNAGAVQVATAGVSA